MNVDDPKGSPIMRVYHYNTLSAMLEAVQAFLIREAIDARATRIKFLLEKHAQLHARHVDHLEGLHRDLVAQYDEVEKIGDPVARQAELDRLDSLVITFRESTDRLLEDVDAMMLELVRA